jgi:hypothetical protein
LEGIGINGCSRLINHRSIIIMIGTLSLEREHGPRGAWHREMTRSTQFVCAYVRAKNTISLKWKMAGPPRSLSPDLIAQI